MPPMQRTLLFALSAGALLALFLVAAGNVSTYILLNFPPIAGISLGIVILAAGLLGVLSAFGFSMVKRQTMRTEIKQYELRKEKAEVKAETTSDQVRVLEAKIQTLEKALAQALSSSSSESNH
jgi:uncharacterized integral membrane protein